MMHDSTSWFVSNNTVPFSAKPFKAIRVTQSQFLTEQAQTDVNSAYTPCEELPTTRCRSVAHMAYKPEIQWKKWFD